jgi:hypothetical protein
VAQNFKIPFRHGWIGGLNKFRLLPFYVAPLDAVNDKINPINNANRRLTAENFFQRSNYFNPSEANFS